MSIPARPDSIWCRLVKNPGQGSCFASDASAYGAGSGLQEKGNPIFHYKPQLYKVLFEKCKRVCNTPGRIGNRGFCNV
jgi:hypothetical protein